MHESSDEAKTLSVAYGNAAMVSSVALAQEMVVMREMMQAQNARMVQLEEEIAALRARLV